MESQNHGGLGSGRVSLSNRMVSPVFFMLCTTVSISDQFCAFPTPSYLKIYVKFLWLSKNLHCWLMICGFADCSCPVIFMSESC